MRKRTHAIQGLLVTFLMAGCTPRSDPAASPDGNADEVFIGQSWRQATEVARSAGYSLHDIASLAVADTSGYYIDLSHKRGLLVIHDRERDRVGGVEWVENWSGAKSKRIYHKVERFKVPPASDTEP